MPPDYVVAQVSVRRVGTTTATAWFWRVFGTRPSDGVLAMPVLPTGGGFDFNILPTDFVSIDEVDRVSLPGGYPAVSQAFTSVDGFASIIAGVPAGMIVDETYAGPATTDPGD